MATSTTDPLFFQLLEREEATRSFAQLSTRLLARDDLEPALARSYFATLVAGAMPFTVADPPEPGQLADLKAYRTAVRTYLADGGLPGRPDGADIDRAAAHLVPANNISPFGHNSPYGYSPPYTLEEVSETLSVFERLGGMKASGDAIYETLVLGKKTGTVCKSIIALWYTASLINLEVMGYPIKTAPIETYASGFVWSVVSGTPMGIPGPYYGNWAYPPPQPVEPPAGR